MTFAEMVKNREWEKIFDILDQGMIDKKIQPDSSTKIWSNLMFEGTNMSRTLHCPIIPIFVDSIL